MSTTAKMIWGAIAVAALAFVIARYIPGHGFTFKDAGK